ncbi:MAG: hypothetical protein E7354_02320 [Clostridiales bacterium]|nr:hypothetical protein [Clostridiales bacterium]
MKENFLHILSSVPCILAVNGEQIGTIDNKNVFEQDIITKTNQIFINYQPLCNEKSFIPYTVTIQTANHPICDSEYIQVVPFPNNHYDIIMKPFYYYEIKDAKVLFSKMTGPYFVSIISSNNTQITIYNNANIVFQTATPKLLNANAELKNEILVIRGIISDTEYYLILIDTSNFEIIHSDISHSIEEIEDNIQSLKYLRNPPHHAEVCKVSIKAKTKDIFYVYEKGNAETTSNKYLMPLYFLEGLKVNDENLCKCLLSQKLSSTPFQKFKNYFGKINDIHLNRHNTSPNINYTILSDEYKNYDFIIDNGKITEIEEIF